MPWKLQILRPCLPTANNSRRRPQSLTYVQILHFQVELAGLDLGERVQNVVDQDEQRFARALRIDSAFNPVAAVSTPNQSNSA